MLYDIFGSEVSNTTEIDKLLKEVNKVDRLTAQLLLREAYELTYKILPTETRKSHPFDLCLHRKQEEVEAYGRTYALLKEYRVNNVKKYYGYNFSEFLELPRHLVNEILRICREEVRVDAKTLSDIENELNSKKKKAP